MRGTKLPPLAEYAHPPSLSVFSGRVHSLEPVSQLNPGAQSLLLPQRSWHRPSVPQRYAAHGVHDAFDRPVPADRERSCM